MSFDSWPILLVCKLILLSWNIVQLEMGLIQKGLKLIIL